MSMALPTRMFAEPRARLGVARPAGVGGHDAQIRNPAAGPPHGWHQPLAHPCLKRRAVSQLIVAGVVSAMPSTTRRRTGSAMPQPRFGP
jgi:hypothetical protein